MGMDIMLKRIMLNCILVYQGVVQEIQAAIAHGVDQGWLIPKISDGFTLAEATEAHKVVTEHHGKGATGKVIISVA